jgi:hypothetical protein
MKNDTRTVEICMHDMQRASGREHTSSGRLQLSSHYGVLERNHIAGRTLNGVRTCCKDVRTDATWNNSKLLDIEEGRDGKFSSSGRMQGIRFF